MQAPALLAVLLTLFAATTVSASDAASDAASLRVKDRDLAADLPGGVVAVATTGAAMLRMDLVAEGAEIKVTGVRADRTGSASDYDVPTLKLLRESTGDDLPGPGDQTLGQAAFVGGTSTIGALDLRVPPGKPETVYLLVDVSSAATDGRNFRLELPDETYVVVDAPHTVDPGPFGFDSSLLVIRTSVPTFLMLSHLDLAAAVPSKQVARGQDDVPMLRLDLRAANGPATLNGVRVDKKGSSARDADVERIRLWQDDGDGQWEPTDTSLASSTFVTATATLGGLQVSLTAGGVASLFLTFDIGVDAIPGTTVRASLADETYLSVASPAMVDPDPFGFSSSELTVSSAPPVGGGGGGGPGGPGLSIADLALFGLVALVAIALGVALIAGRHRRRGAEPAPVPAPPASGVAPR